MHVSDQGADGMVSRIDRITCMKEKEEMGQKIIFDVVSVRPNDIGDTPIQGDALE